MMGAMAEQSFYDEEDRKQYEADQASIAARKRRDRLNSIVQTLQTKADDQVKKKVHIEERWLNDMRQFYGRYDEKTEKDLNAPNSSKSKLFFNITRMKTNGWEARLTDMLFPTDDRNWGIKPTPVPEIDNAPVPQIPEAAYPQPEQGAAMSAKLEMDAKVAEAKKRAEAMEEEIDDQFREADYYAKCRDMIGDACQIGTGIIKAPVVSAKNIRRWGKAEGGPDEGGYVLASIDDPSPDALSVDPWSFFPDMSASSVDDAEFFFERHLSNKKQLRDLAKTKGFDKEAIRELLEEGPQEGGPDFVANLREITGVGEFDKSDNQKYQVWEYHGPLEPEDIETVCHCIGKDDLLGDIEDHDILEEIHVVAWFCQNRLIKFGLHLLDSQEPIYSVFNLEKDKRCIFGFGVPALMRDSQKSLSAAWRMILDNAGLSTGPQVVIDKDAIAPADGTWALAPRKVWLKKSTAIPISEVFGTFSIDSHQSELANIVQMSRQFADEETALPLVAQGESGSHQTQTAQGMSMLMNSVNVVFRRVIKNYDDDVTVRTVRRFYDWNMQFNPREDIKGDYNVDARGSSVLLVREMQAQNLLGMMNMFGAHPVFGPMTKHADLYRKAVQAHSIAADEIVLTDQEIATMQQKQAEAEANGGNDPAMELEIAKLNTQLEVAQIDQQTKIETARLNHESAMMKLAADQQTTVEKIKAQLTGKQMEIDSKERTFAAEAAISSEIGPSGGGSF